MSHKNAQKLLEILEKTKNTHFKDKHNTHPYTQWKQKRTQIKEHLNKLPKYINQTVETINPQEQKTGRPPKIDLEKKTNLFTFIRLINKSNRQTEKSLQHLQPSFDIELSYKYIERLYSDQGIKLVLHNVFVLLLKDENMVEI